ncbi:MAG: cell division protein ZipA [Gammaproteobacteria bacterium]|nr:cell division protein ZipA [Gammaproteobacteria bacterium]
MDGLRWLLLLFGLLVIGGVYLYSQREKKTDNDQSDSGERIAPSLDGNGLDEVDDEVSVTAPTIGNEPADPELEDDADAEAAAEDAPQKIVTLRVVARESKSFAGDELILSMRGIGLRHGKFGIFHRYDGNDESRTVFSAASLVEPGSFDLQNVAEQQIPGISLFLVLPGPIDSVEAFDLMMSAARTLAQSLEGELLDETGSTLSIQRERYLREEIIQYQHSNLVS